MEIPLVRRGPRRTHALRGALAAALLAPALATAAVAQPPTPPGPPEVGEDTQSTDNRGRRPDPAAVERARSAAARDGEVRLVVTLRTRFTPEGTLTEGEELAQRREIAEKQGRALGLVRREAVVRRFETLPLLALTATPAEVERLAASEVVADVRPDRLVSPGLAGTTSVVGSPAVNGRGVTGQGQTIAVLDTGVDRNHPFVVGRVVDEACFGSCPNGESRMTGPGSGVPCPAGVAGCDHGTHVAGIAAGAQGPNNVGFNGVAPGARLLSVNVFHRVDNVWPFTPCGADPSPCARAWLSDYVAGLEYVYTRRGAFSIAAVNLSLGDDWENTSECTGSWVRPAVDNLRSVGIATVVAAGNSGHDDGLSEPACVPSAVSVGAVTDGGSVPAFSNSASYLDLLAPGVNVTSSVPGGGFAGMSGTSMAAPHVAGGLALLRQAHPAAGVTELVSRLQRTGVPVRDPKSGRTTRRIDLDRASRSASFTSDFTRDLKADSVVWRPSTGQWWVPGESAVVWGQPGDKPVPGDYDGNGSVEKAIWRPSTGTWWIPGIGTVQWGLQGDVPVPGDYNGDGRSDLAVWRPSTGDWWVRGQFTQQWGLSGDVPVPGDYNADGRTDVAVWRPSTGDWWVRGQFTQQWGVPGDHPVPADYNGDGRTDVAVWRPSTGDWWVRGQFTQQWGAPGDVPTPRDTNGDGRAELVVWRAGNGTWFTLQRTVFGNLTSSFPWGQNGDVPVGPAPRQLV